MITHQYHLLFVIVVLSTAGGAMVPTVVQTTSEPTQLDSCTTITEPGRYVLVQDIENPPARATCIEIQSSDVIFEGNNHYLNTDRDIQTRRIGVTAANVENVTVQNVTLSNWTVGIAFEGVESGHITGNRIEDTQWGVDVDNTTATVITQNTVRQEGNGIVVGPNGQNVSVERNYVNTTTFTGVVVWAVNNSRVIDNVIRGYEGAAGIGVRANRTILRNNTVFTDGAAIGVTGSGAHVVENTVRGYIGISILGNENVIRGNTASRNELFGITVLDNSTVIENNTASENGVAGILLQGVNHPSVSNTIANNLVYGNEEYGIDIVGGDEGSQPTNLSVRNNTVTENRNAGIHLETVNDIRLQSNYVANNTDGIALTAHEFNPFETENVTVVGNCIVHNDRTGVGIQRAVKAETVTLHRNTIAENGEVGIQNEAAFIVDARRNYWGDPTGPSSPISTNTSLRDPVTGTLADGRGDAISASTDPLLENQSHVHFDPWLRQPAWTERRERLVAAC